jgi:hypothetical protein
MPPPPGWQPGPPWPPQPLGQQPWVPAGGRKGRRVGLIVGGVVAAVAVVIGAVVAVIVAFSGTSATPEQQIRSQIDHALDAYNRHDMAAFRGYVCGPFLSDVENGRDAARSLGSFETTVKSVYVHGDSATVDVLVGPVGEAQVHGNMRMERHDGEWKVCELIIEKPRSG